jgi:hypothetical protein
MHLSVPAFPKLALLLSLTGLLVGREISFRITPSYISQATLQLAPAPGSAPADLRPDVAVLEQQVLSRTSLSAIIKDPHLDLYRSERTRQPLTEVIETMRTRDLHITLARTTPAGATPLVAPFMISFTTSDPVKAHDVVQILITKFVDANLDRQPAPPVPPETVDQVAPLPERINLDVLDPPSLPVTPTRPDRAAFAFVGFGSGFLAATTIAILRRGARPANSLPAVSA